MSHKFDKIVVLDIECCAWESKNHDRDEMETLEVGVCFLDVPTLNISDPVSFYCRPEKAKISDYCSRLTGITWDTVKAAPPFVGVCNKLRKIFGTRNRTIATWGNGDIEHFYFWCKQKNVDMFPLNKGTIDVSLLYSHTYNKQNVNLTKAIESLGMKFEGRQHCAKDDAYNTARILKHFLLKNRG